ncbi:MAG: cupin domain-containing protein [Anaerolineales bacterium]|jgi:transcriptional regulator with XRE-family HTH domain|nr:cupin domain-containing protein [Anaerolineales bacterium]
MEKISVGSKLRSIREERNLSQRELAQLAGISTNAISLIERDENSPSVATLQSLAAALNVKMSYFFDDHEPSTVLHVKAEQRPAITSKGVRIEGLDGKLSRQEMEPFWVSLQPHSDMGERQVVHTGHELVYCLSGKVEYLIDGNIYELEAGDFLLFEAHLPHLWRNRTDQPASFLLVLQASGQAGEPVKRHFSDYPSVLHIGKS